MKVVLCGDMSADLGFLNRNDDLERGIVDVGNIQAISCFDI